MRQAMRSAKGGHEYGDDGASPAAAAGSIRNRRFCEKQAVLPALLYPAWIRSAVLTKFMFALDTILMVK